jgi:hypothetical protein
MTVAIKDAVERAFSIKNKNNEYLLTLADEHPAVFCSLVSKCIPTAVAVDIKHSLDLGAAMLEASQRLQQFNNTIEHETINLIPNTQQPVTLEPDSLETEELIPISPDLDAESL